MVVHPTVFGGRVRLSTVVLCVLFAGVLVLYGFVRPPSPTDDTGGTTGRTPQPKATPTPERSNRPTPHRTRSVTPSATPTRPSSPPSPTVSGSPVPSPSTSGSGLLPSLP